MNLPSLPRQIAEQIPGESAALDAQVLLAHVLGHDRSWLLAHPEARPSPEQQIALEAAIRKLQDGMPLPYVLGRWEFFGLDFIVTPDVLIPRPETELLVETALRWVRTNPQSARRFLDVGTGSGCIPISLAVHIPDAGFTATDISPAALAIARRNAQRHGVADRITFVECDLLPQTVDGGRWAVNAEPSTVHHPWSTVDMDIVTANLPYIPTGTLNGLPVSRREPTLALDGGADGLDLVRRLLAGLKEQLSSGCLALLEIETSQGRAARDLAEGAFPGAQVQIRKDLAGHDRLVVIET